MRTYANRDGNCRIDELMMISENLKGRGHEEDLGADGVIILKWVLGKEGAGVRQSVYTIGYG